MISKKDVEILSFLRKNARESIIKISKEIGIPASTIYDRVRVQNRMFVKKHAILLDFPKIGFHSQVLFAVECKKNNKEQLQDYLMNTPNVNSLSKTNFGSDFVIECIFRDFGEAERFKEILEKEYKVQINTFNIVEELKKEDFLTDASHYNVLKNNY